MAQSLHIDFPQFLHGAIKGLIKQHSFNLVIVYREGYVLSKDEVSRDMSF
jgi:hypothetical protein